MRRLILRVTAGIVLATATITANAQSGRASLLSRWGQFWGTWVWQTTYPSGNVIPTMVTYHIDGTITASDGTMFRVQPSATTRATPMQGVWERTSWQSLGGTSLYLTFNATGGLTAWGRARSSLQFADDFDHFQAKMFVETLPCASGPPVTCPNPQDAAAKWVPVPNLPPDGFPVTGTRLDRVPAGPLH